MCPTTDLWRDKVKGIVHRLASDYGVQGIYLDQIAAAAPALCFDDGHNHPRGGGDWWVEGYRTMLGELQREVSGIDPEFFITTESNAEPWNDLLDALLMCNSTQGDLIPLYPTVYGDRVLTYGAYIYPDDIERTWPFRTKVSQMFLWGTQLGWFGFSILEKGFGRDAEYLAELARTRVLAHDYLASGRMLRPPVPDGDVDLIKTRWELWKGSWDVEMPGAQATAWREPGGGIGIVACNMMDKEVDLKVEMALKDLGWSRDRARRMVSKGHFGTARVNFDSMAVEVDLGPRAARLLT
jgi:hypothetical protein